jgi:PAS domain S-box-containing protein/putative nucleotidyltransferase with HDIG domain
VHSLSWQESYARLKRWEIDMTTSVAVTPERNEFWAFTRPYMKIPIVIIARTDVTFIADMRELSGKKVAVVDGYAAADWIPRDFPDIHLVKVKTVKEGIDLLQKEEAFAFVENMLVIGYYMAKLKMMNLKIAGETPYINAQCMAVRKDWEILAGILQKALDSISETERSNIYKKWLPVRYEHGFNYSLLWQALAIFAAILLALVVWIKKLSGEIRHRKEAEAALSNSEERLRTTLDNMIEGGQIISFDWKYLYVNDSAILHGRMTREKLLGKTLMEAYPGIEKTEVFTRLKECMENRVNLRMDNEFIYSDGSSGWFRLSIQPVPEGIFVLSENITEQKRATEALRKAHARLRCFVDANIVGIVIASQSGVVIEANDYYLGLIGYTREEFEQGMVNWRAITPPEWFYADDHAIEELRERGTCTPYEKEYIRRDGTWVSVFLSDAMLPGPEEHIAAFVLDITDRKKAEERQKISEDKYRNIFENAVEGIFQTTIQGQFLSANPAMAKMIGYDSPAELISSINDIKEQLYVNPEDRATLINVLKEKNAVEGFELHQRRRDGSSFWALVNVRAVMDEAGNILYLEGTHEDITHRKLAEEELKQTMEKLRKSLSGIIQVISLTVETRDPYTAGHQKRVSNLAGAIAQKIGLQKDVIDNICTAGIIHDIGKISIPAEILSKPGTLTDIEFSLIKSHSQSGYDILKNVELPYPIAEIVLQHHERLDGSGYPRGLKA